MNYFTPFVHVQNQQKEQRSTLPVTNPSEPLLFSNEINRLLSAAVVNQRFCNLLLSDPSRAIAIGFNGESFSFSNEEKSLLLNIKATTLQSFAEQVMTLTNSAQSGNGKPEARPHPVTEPARAMCEPGRLRTPKPTVSLSSR